jgi:phosphoribosyl 1,2-cyclic phosphodiesterase
MSGEVHTLQFASLGSGSKGNSTVVRAGETLVMVDCGFSLRDTLRRLARLDIAPEQLDAILVTHEHSDHCSGVAALSRKFEIPVYMTHGTSGTGRCDNSHDLHCFNCEDTFTIGALSIKAVAVPHDAAEPCQYRISWQDHTLGILTDLGSITPHVVDNYRSCDSLLLEFNHDVSMLQNGQYPPHLKRRVGGDWGHLNNDQAADFLRQIDSESLRQVVVAHVSEKNNSRERAEGALLSVLGSLDKVVFAQQSEGFDWLKIA